MYFVYIIHSVATRKYYTGSCADFLLRLQHNNAGHNRSTKSGVPWTVVRLFEVADRTEALKLELRIKKRGAGRFLADMGTT
jgi:putative endonuclease